jgi:hypothetical protein
MDTQNKQDALYAIEVNRLPTANTDKQDLAKYSVINLGNIASLGVGFKSVIDAICSVSTKGGGSGLYKVVVDSGQQLAYSQKKGGFIGSTLSAVTNRVAGQATLQRVSCDPTMMFMALALSQIHEKLDAIKELQLEILSFLAQKERSDMKGDINFLIDVMNHYKFNWENDTYKNSNHIKVLDILHSSERKIDFFRKQISAKIYSKMSFHSDKKVEKQLQNAVAGFRDYQVSLYAFAFSSFLQVMLLENFDPLYLGEVAGKVERYASAYKALYLDAVTKIQANADTSIQSLFLKGVAAVSNAAGKTIAKIPQISKTQLDENLIASEEKVLRYSSDRTEKTLTGLGGADCSFVEAFSENIRLVAQLNNQPIELLFDSNNFYLSQTVA